MAARRVLMTTDTVGGVWTYSLDLARWLGRRGVDVVLAALGPPPSEDQISDALAVPTLDLREKPCKFEWMPEPWEDVERAGEWLLQLARDTRPDVVHLNQFSFGDLPWDSPALIVGHSCVLSWWRAVRGEDAPEGWLRYRDRVQAGLQAADLVVAPSRAMMQCLQAHYGPLCRSRVIPNARHPEGLQPCKKLPYVLSAGRVWDEAKGLDVLDSAARRLSCPVFVAGEGGKLRHCRSLGRLSSNDLAAWLSEASIYCLPARYEPFGLSVLEAALSGCALVLGDIASLRENWSGAAIFVTPGDSDGLAGIINRLVADHDLREDLAGRALRRAQRFNPHDTTDAYLHAYQTIVARSRAVLL